MEETAAEMDVKQSAGKETKPADKKEQSKLTDERIAKIVEIGKTKGVLKLSLIHIFRFYGNREIQGYKGICARRKN